MLSELNTYLPVDDYDSVNSNNLKDCLIRRPVVEHIERYKWILGNLKENGEKAWPLLEVGTGCSWGLRQIQNNFNSISVGVDLNINALSEGIQAGIRNVSQADLLAENLPFSDGQFSTIVNLNLLEQLTNPLAALKNMGRVAKIGAKMYVSIFNRELFSPGGKRWFLPNQHEFSKGELTELLSASGWQAIDWFGQRFVSKRAYLKNATRLQIIEDWLNQSEWLSKDRRVQIFRARVQNIFPSLSPSVKVVSIDDKPNMEPVILTAECLRI